MVLHKSKWDRKAKIQYLKKHGIQKPAEPTVVRPKWSGKKTEDPKRTLVLDDSDSDWDSDDEALVNHIYPQIGEQQLTVEQKMKIKKQIIAGIVENEAKEKEEKEELENEHLEEDEMGGIYLGNPEDEPLLESLALPELEARLSEFVVSGKSRKMLKNKVSDNLLDEYGIASYASTVKKTDYSHAQELKIEKLTAQDLHGFRIGEALQPKTDNIRTLTAEERQEHSDRAQKVERARLYSQMKSAFGEKAKLKVLEINNFNSADQRLMDTLNLKLVREAPKKVNVGDLDELLGISGGEVETEVDLDELLKMAGGREEERVERECVVMERKDESFLDDLLG